RACPSWRGWPSCTSIELEVGDDHGVVAYALAEVVADGADTEFWRREDAVVAAVNSNAASPATVGNREWAVRTFALDLRPALGIPVDVLGIDAAQIVAALRAEKDGLVPIPPFGLRQFQSLEERCVGIDADDRRHGAAARAQPAGNRDCLPRLVSSPPLTR